MNTPVAGKEILRVIVGSQAHGLATPESDIDRKSVFILPTVNFLLLGVKPLKSTWSESLTDDITGYELGHFLQLATASNPTILEVFMAHPEHITPEGSELRLLFPHIWDSDAMFAAFRGYGHNQRTKLFKAMDSQSERELRGPKYAVAWARTLQMGIDLLEKGRFALNIRNTDLGSKLRVWRSGYWTLEEVIATTRILEERLADIFARTPRKTPDLDKINQFLLDTRQNNFWIAQPERKIL